MLDLDLRGSDCKSASPPVTESNPSTCIMNVSLSRSRLARRSSSQPPPRAGFATERETVAVARRCPCPHPTHAPAACLDFSRGSRRFHWARLAISAPSLVVTCCSVGSRAVSRDRQNDDGEVIADGKRQGAEAEFRPITAAAT